FDYAITDGRVATPVTGTVLVLVNTPPPAPIVSIPVPHGHTGPFTFDAAALLGGMTDADGDPLTIQLRGQPFFGTVMSNADGTFTYVPNPPDGLVPAGDQFQFRLDDGFTAGDNGVAFLHPDERPVA